MNGNKRTVWIVAEDRKKDFTAAEKYGELKVVFSGHYSPSIPMKSVVKQARRVLSKAHPGDYLLFVGDPVLCALCGVIMAERMDDIHTLRWDRFEQEYKPIVIDLKMENEDE